MTHRANANHTVTNITTFHTRQDERREPWPTFVRVCFERIMEYDELIMTINVERAADERKSALDELESLTLGELSELCETVAQPPVTEDTQRAKAIEGLIQNYDTVHAGAKVASTLLADPNSMFQMLESALRPAPVSTAIVPAQDKEEIDVTTATTQGGAVVAEDIHSWSFFAVSQNRSLD